MANVRIITDALGFGILLWMIGFSLGMILFPFVPVAYIGLPILLIVIPLTFLVSYYRFKRKGFTKTYYLTVAALWLLIAVIFDYTFLVRGFNVQNYYDLDIIVYYAMTFIIPLSVGIKFGKK